MNRILNTDNINETWVKLEEAVKAGSESGSRISQRLSLDKESGIRLSCLRPDGHWEILIHISSSENDHQFDFPKWSGMDFNLIQLDTPVPGSWHMSIMLTGWEHKDVFVTVCEDLIESLDKCTDLETRRSEFQEFIYRWSKFFENCNFSGLTVAKQVGLVGELCFLSKIIEAGIDPVYAMKAWKGCDRAYHDFEIRDHVVEVKATSTKEPRKVMINNERQLDNNGLTSLYLYVYTFSIHDSNGMTLPDWVNGIIKRIKSSSQASMLFDHSLKKAGYLHIHSPLYVAEYVTKREDLFLVREGFPRIIDMPPGVGDIKYSLTLSTCEDYKVNIDDFLNLLNEGL